MRKLIRRSQVTLAATGVAALLALGGLSACGNDDDNASLESQEATSTPSVTAAQCKSLKGAAKTKCLRKAKQLQQLQQQAP